MLPVLVLALTLHAGDAPAPAADQTPSHVRDGLLIGAVGLAVTGAYTVGAVLTGDKPSGHPLAIAGGVVSLGLVSASVTVMILSWRKNPWGLLTYALATVGAGLAGAAIGGLAAHFGAVNPGPGRTATHGVIIGLCVTETVLIELARLVR